MYDIAAKNCRCESCASDKEELSLIYPHNDMHFVLSGKGYYNGKPVLPGEGFICRRDKFESYVQDKNDPWRYCFVRLAGSDIDIFFSQYKDSDYRFTFDLCEDFLSFANAGDIINGQKLNDYEIGKNFFNIIVKYIDGQNQSGTMLSAGQNAYVERAKSIIQSNYWTSLSVTKIAGDLHINPDYLRTLFKKYEGVSTQEYILNYRIKRAKAFLELGEFKITDIASSVGYENLSQFAKLFKQKTGISPTAYRNSRCVK